MKRNEELTAWALTTVYAAAWFQAGYLQAEHADQPGHYSTSFGHLHFVIPGPNSSVTVAH